MRRLTALAGASLLISALAIPAGAMAHPGQHGTLEGHLIGEGAWDKIEFIAKVPLSAAGPELVADVAVGPVSEDGSRYAYLANWGDPDCPFFDDIPGNEAGGRKNSDAGVWVVDISDLDNPEEVAFIPMSQDTRPGEGMQVLHIDTDEFTGDVLAVNEEFCGKNAKAGFSLWDVTDPENPKKLAKNFGDLTIDGLRVAGRDANQTHSVFMWTTGENAYLVAQDEMESADIDIFDITDPKHPVLIAEVDANDFDVAQPEIGLTDSFHHDVSVKQIDGQWVMLVSYWDGGWVLLDVDDPANPAFIADTQYDAVDPLIGGGLPPEGNAHQAEFTSDNQFFIGTDEDFAPFKLFLAIADGADQPVSAGTATPADEDVYIGPGETLSGPTVFLGNGCAPVAPLETEDPTIAVVERGACDFQVKIDNATAAGYDAIIIFNSTTGVPPCESLIGMLAETTIPAYFVSRSVGYAVLGIDDYNPDNCPAGTNPPLLDPGEPGEDITLSSQFDGWGYVRLFDSTDLENPVEVAQFAIPEALDPEFAEGFGDLSVHEVAVDPQDPSLAYLAYYSGGLRAIQIQCTDPADTSTCQLVEVGGYLDPEGNNFWGVETFVAESGPYEGRTIILASDRDSGLWIFVDP